MLPSCVRRLRAAALTAVAALLSVLSACQTSELTRRNCDDDDCPGHAHVCEKPTIRALASDLDSLERHIEKYGSVVAQHASVWGQARLTAHRQQFENEMVKELPNFVATLNGTLSRTDQAYFINALSLSSAASSAAASPSPSGICSLLGSCGSGGSSSSSSSAAPAPSSILDPSVADITGAFTGMTRNPTALPALTGFAGLAAAKGGGVNLEPTTYLDQKKSFLDHLNELRRINEGDDTADAPGYSLNLVRIPVSVLPGKCTERGYGAEVTMTLKPYLSDELLPITFRNLIINDLLEVVGVPLTQLLNDRDQLEALDIIQKIKKNETAPANKAGAARRDGRFQLELASLPSAAQDKKDGHTGNPPVMKPYSLWQQSSKDMLKKYLDRAPRPGSGGNVTPSPGPSQESFDQIVAASKVTIVRISASKLHRADRPFPISQLLDIYGGDAAYKVAKTANDTLRQDPANKYWIHYPDVQGYLQDELKAAYNFLAEPAHQRLWASYCTPELVSAIHTRNLSKIDNIREKFNDEIVATTGQNMHDDVTVALAWAIIVESALLNQHLTEDILEAAVSKGCACPTVQKDSWLDFYMPRPSELARQAFNQYVQCRWPIIAFALDPAADQQNIADTFSQSREMQLAMSLAFVSGNISANNLTRYARRLETQMEAIQLNNTITGFSHGNDTFGWRFYPRFQTPDTEGNMTVFFRDLLLGDQKKDTLLRQRKLEPGQRECTAIVIMPSFVPYCTLDVSSSWFKLTNPKCRDLTCVDAIKLSARVKAIDQCADRVQDARCYRDGELDRLKKKAKQLEARLPLQDMMVQVPYENTLGGFAMFNTGITDLAPELYGWYGAPGINTTDTTSLFLIGNHFNVMSTRVIAGGLNIGSSQIELLSRQVMRVTIPKGALTIDRATGTFQVDPVKPTPAPALTPPDLKAIFGKPNVPGVLPDPPPPAAAPAPQELFVDVHIATPYGVTSHLLIPALGKASTQGSGAPAHNQIANWSPNAIAVGYVLKGLGIAHSNPPTVRPSDLAIKLATPVNNANNAELALKVTGNGTGVSATFTLVGVAIGSDQQTLSLSPAARDAMIAAVFDKLGPQYDKNLDPKTNPGTISLTKITLKQDTAVVGTITLSASADLTVNWIAAHVEKQPEHKAP